MTIGTLFRLFICLFALGMSLYLTINRQNEITKLRIAIPQLAKEINEIHEENTRLHFEIESFENPLHLMQLARLSEYSHLKHPINKHILVLREGDPLTLPDHPSIQKSAYPSKLSLAAILFNDATHRD